jgi:hypothetical protein
MNMLLDAGKGCERQTNLSSCVQNFQVAWDTLVLEYLLIPVFNGRVILDVANARSGGRVSRSPLPMRISTHSKADRKIVEEAPML